jgi:uncharacterized protein with ParB-like and HNH nuclease domain
MALSLSAEQKSIKKILTNDRFIIPSYQRPYSWTEEQCRELWDDLVTFFQSDKRDEGYFLGNIIFAKSDEIEELEVIDGQQRLITLSLLLKALSFYDTDNDVVADCLWHTDRRDKNKKIPRLKTVVFEEKDNSLFIACINEKEKVIYNQTQTKNNRFKSNLSFFINQFEDNTEEVDITDFSDFLLDKVYVLPIQSVDKEQDNAREKALTIFETINNRGLDLSDADIFKAQLFNSALNNGRHEDFIANWNQLEEFCNDAIPATKKNEFRPLVDVFRIYMQILRGKSKSINNEIGLRQFFTNLPLKKKDEIEAMNDLNHIVASVKFVNDVLNGESLITNSELQKWLQLIDLYSNLYPKYAIYVYLFVNAKFDNYNLISANLDTDKFTALVKELVRYAYYTGSTSKIKYEIYKAIVKISHNEVYKFPIEEKNFSETSLYNFGLIKKGVALLAMYLDGKQLPVNKTFYLDNLVTTTNYKTDSNWKTVEVYDYIDTLGNLYVTDNKNTTDRRLPTSQKIKLLQNSPFISLASLNQQWTIKEYKVRQKILKEKLRDFFLGEI